MAATTQGTPATSAGRAEISLDVIVIYQLTANWERSAGW
jgi:hypothetical protein